MTIITENRRRWVEALRSGDYKQGWHVLRHSNLFCCLGVACDIADGEWDKVDGEEDAWEFDNETYTLSPRMRAELGLTAEQVQQLITLNDNGDSFEEIADHIEALP